MWSLKTGGLSVQVNIKVGLTVLPNIVYATLNA